MKRTVRPAFSLCSGIFLGALVAAGSAPAARAAVSPETEGDSPRVLLRGNVHPLARPEFDIGESDPHLPMERIILHLARRPGADLELQQLLADQQNPSSPDFHHWLTPEEFGERFGLPQESLSRIVAWLQEQGFTVDEVARGRGWINFTGTAAQVERSFRAPMHDYLVGGKIEHANAADPSLPGEIAGLVRGIVSLHSFHARPLISRRRPISPEELRPAFNGGTGTHYLGPGDFAVIYNTNPLFASGIDGSGQTIAIVGRTDIKLEDVQYFRSYFGLPPRDPVFIHNGPDPGDLGDDGSTDGLNEENEADLDVEWSGAVAPQATIDFVISKSTAASDGVDLSAQYIVDNNLAPIMSESFGDCESDLGSAGNSFENAIYAQAAAEGITVFVASADSGAAGCDSPSGTTGHGLAVNGLCSPPSVVCVGGTMFDDTSDPSAYWAATSPPPGRVSALSYIPEKAWNESASTPDGSNLYATGGG
ncbi:MAG: protease pro-enzyme activation domain-containing protein, partial [Verrucomicrobiota bacterium]